MHQAASAIDRISKLREEIAQLQERAITELKEKRLQLSIELHEVESEIARLTGKVPGGQKRTRRAATTTFPRACSLEELKDLLTDAPGKTLNVRKDNLDLGSIKSLAAEHPQVFKLGGKGAWPTITLVR